jgi:hypothetical protein
VWLEELGSILDELEQLEFVAKSPLAAWKDNAARHFEIRRERDEHFSNYESRDVDPDYTSNSPKGDPFDIDDLFSDL